jgi:hypothetical protein
MSESNPPRELDRRGFLAALAAAAAAIPSGVLAQTATPAPTATPTPPEHTGSEARLLTEVLRTRYPDRFDEKQWGSIVGDFDGDLAAGKRLRAVKLKNSDEPDFTFKP